MATFKREFNFNKNVKEIVSNNIRKYRLLAGITELLKNSLLLTLENLMILLED